MQPPQLAPLGRKFSRIRQHGSQLGGAQARVQRQHAHATHHRRALPPLLLRLLLRPLLLPWRRLGQRRVVAAAHCCRRQQFLQDWRVWHQQGVGRQGQAQRGAAVGGAVEVDASRVAAHLKPHLSRGRAGGGVV